MKAEWTNKDVLIQSETTGQSKSILVIDTPKNCAKCNLMFLQGIGESICNAVDWSRRPSWCPLKPLPQKRNTSKLQDFGNFQIVWTDRTIYQNEGWNACLDAILGETE